MTAAQAIAMLDRQMVTLGQDVTLRRMVVNGQPIEKPSRAFVRGYRPDELSGGIQQGDSLVTLSPTHIPAEFSGAQNRLRLNDRIVIRGRTRNVQYVDPVEIAGTVVRLNVQVRG